MLKIKTRDNHIIDVPLHIVGRLPGIVKYVPDEDDDDYVYANIIDCSAVVPLDDIGTDTFNRILQWIHMHPEADEKEVEELKDLNKSEWEFFNIHPNEIGELVYASKILNVGSLNAAICQYTAAIFDFVRQYITIWNVMNVIKHVKMMYCNHYHMHMHPNPKRNHDDDDEYYTNECVVNEWQNVMK